MTTLFLVAAACYVLELLWLRWGLAKADRTPTNPSYEPTVSIVVAARNEEDRISECLSSLAALDYPASKLELLIVDDRSTDRTGELIDEFSRRHPGIKKILSGPPAGNLYGKANALYHGVAASTGEILMFTDADCRVPPTWVRSTVSSFDDKAGVVGGYTLLDAQSSFEGMQQLDWLFLFSIAGSAAGWGLPLTVIGNNLSVRRTAYDAAGGYGQIPFSVTEDYSLVQAILTKTSYEVRFPLDRTALIASQACQSMKQLFRQKQRWGVGGLDMVLRGMIIMTIGWVYRALLIVSWLYVPMSYYLGTLLIVLLAELIFLARTLRVIGSTRSLRYFPAFQMYYIPYVLFTPLVAFFSKNIVWKERKLKKEGN